MTSLNLATFEPVVIPQDHLSFDSPANLRIKFTGKPPSKSFIGAWFEKYHGFFKSANDEASQFFPITQDEKEFPDELVIDAVIESYSSNWRDKRIIMYVACLSEDNIMTIMANGILKPDESESLEIDLSIDPGHEFSHCRRFSQKNNFVRNCCTRMANLFRFGAQQNNEIGDLVSKGKLPEGTPYPSAFTNRLYNKKDN